MISGMRRAFGKKETEATKWAKERKPKVLVKKSPVKLSKEAKYHPKTNLPTFDRLLGPGVQLTSALAAMKNTIVQFTENLRSFGAQTEGSAVLTVIENEMPKGLPKIAILGSQKQTLATIDAEAGLVVEDVPGWEELAEMCKDKQYKIKVSVNDLAQNLAEWFKFIVAAMERHGEHGATKCIFGLKENTPFPVIVAIPEDDPLSGVVEDHAAWTSREISYVARRFYGYVQCCYPTKHFTRTIFMDEMLRRKKARTSAGRKGTRKAIGELIQRLKKAEKDLRDVHADKDKLKKAFEEADADKSGNIDIDELTVLCEKLKMNKTPVEVEEMFFAADKDESGAIDFDEFPPALLELADAKKKEWEKYFEDKDMKRLRKKGCMYKDKKKLTKLTFIDAKGKKVVGKKKEKRLLKEMMAEQKIRDAVVKDWSKIVMDGIDKANLVMVQMRSTLSKTCKTKYTAGSVLEKIKVMLAAVADGKPSLAIERDFKLLFKGKNPITGVRLDIGGTNISEKMPKTDMYQFIYDTFFNLMHPNNVLNIFRIMALNTFEALRSAGRLGLRIANIAVKCLPPFPIIGLIQAEVVAVCMTSCTQLDFSIRKVPGLLLKHIRSFGGFPAISMAFAKSAKGIMNLIGGMKGSSNPGKALTLKEGSEEEPEDQLDDAVDMSELGADFAKTNEKASAASKEADGAEAEQGKLVLSEEDREAENFVTAESDAETEAGDETDAEEDYDLSDEVLEQKFSELDVDHDGEITRIELDQALKDTGRSFTSEALKKLIDDADTNSDGGIDIEEFKNAMRAGKTVAPLLSERSVSVKKQPGQRMDQVAPHQYTET